MQQKMLCTEQAEQQGAPMLLVHDGSRLFVSLFFVVCCSQIHFQGAFQDWNIRQRSQRPSNVDRHKSCAAVHPPGDRWRCQLFDQNIIKR
jgi:hypothetical protein